MKKLHSTSPNWKDNIIWPILKLIWEPYSKKRSHWWHWKKYDGTVGEFITIDGDPNTNPRDNFWKDLFYTNLFWTKCAVLKPKNYNGQYRRGFRAFERGEIKNEICEILLSGPHAGLVGGPNDTEFFALSYPDNIPIELKLLEITTKYKLKKEIPLL